MAAVDIYAARIAGVVAARLGGPRARKGTRHWAPTKKLGAPEGSATTSHIRPGVELKAIDPEYVVPGTLVGEIVETMRPVALQVTRDAARDAAGRLRDEDPDTAMFEVDQELLDDLINEALEDLLGVADRYADNLRETILTGESEGLDMDTLLDNVEEAATRGGNWLRLGARTIGTALAGKSSLEQARALGVTHTQWVSRRDDRVRLTHVAADGQVRPVGDSFRVGAHLLEYPGDPTGLPDTISEVAGCRCGLIFASPDQGYLAALAQLAASAAAGDDDPAARELMSVARVSTAYAPGPGIAGLPGIGALAETPADVVGWRVLDAVLDVVPGQQVTLPAGTTLGLAAPAELTRETLGVLIPAGTLVSVAGGTMTLGDAAVVQVLAAGGGGVQGTLAAP